MQKDRTKIATIIWPEGGIWREEGSRVSQEYMDTARAAQDNHAIFIGEIVEAMDGVECGSGTICVCGRTIEYVERSYSEESNEYNVIFDFFDASE